MQTINGHLKLLKPFYKTLNLIFVVKKQMELSVAPPHAGRTAMHCSSRPTPRKLTPLLPH